jgi:hypothetical protein
VQRILPSFAPNISQEESSGSIPAKNGRRQIFMTGLHFVPA